VSTGPGQPNLIRAKPGAAGKRKVLSSKLVAAVENSDESDVARLCGQYKLKRGDLGRLSGFSLRALAEWSAGRLPSEPARRRLHEVRRLLDALAQVVTADAIPNWLRQPNPAFDGITPIQVIELGEIDRLWHMVHIMASDTLD
jgi:DNA-binding transcriptional regulator YiaG